MSTLDEIFNTQPMAISNVNTATAPLTLDKIFGTDQQIEDELSPSFWETDTGRLAGSIAGGIAGFQTGVALAPPVAPVVGPLSKPIGGILGGAVGAGFGGFVGDVAQSQYQIATDSELAPKTTDEMLDRAYRAGGEEALYDLAGGLFFKGGSKLWSIIRPKKIEGIEEVQKAITKHGGELTAVQMTNHKLIDTVEGLVEASWGGNLLAAGRETNREAIRKYADDYITHFSSTAGKHLTDEGIGTLFLNSLETGTRIHSEIGGTYYKNLDTLYKQTFKNVLVNKEVPTNILDASGNMLSKKTTQTIQEEILPVSTKALKEFARKLLKEASPIKGKSLPTWGKNELTAILGFGDTISFELAQKYRSKLLAEARTAGKGANSQLGEGGSVTLVASLSKITDDIITDAAQKTKNPEFIKAWREANKFWKEGKDAFNNQFIAKLAKGNASAIGKKLFNSDIEDIRKAKVALRKAAKLSKGTSDEFSFGEVYGEVQQGFMQKILGDAMTPKAGTHADAISLDNLGKWFQKNTVDGNRFMAAFNKEQRDGLQIFVNSVKAMQKQPKGFGSFMITVGQAGLVINALQGTIPALQFAGDIGVYTIGPMVLAKLLTHPTWSKRIAGVIRMNGRPELGTAATASVMKLIAASQDINILGE